MPCVEMHNSRECILDMCRACIGLLDNEPDSLLQYKTIDMSFNEAEHLFVCTCSTSRMSLTRIPVYLRGDIQHRLHALTFHHSPSMHTHNAIAPTLVTPPLGSTRTYLVMSRLECCIRRAVAAENPFAHKHDAHAAYT